LFVSSITTAFSYFYLASNEQDPIPDFRQNSRKSERYNGYNFYDYYFLIFQMSSTYFENDNNKVNYMNQYVILKNKVTLINLNN